MKKIMSILIVSLFLSLGVTSVVTGNEVMDGAIDVEVREWSWNLVAPTINLEENQSLTLNVEVETEDDTTTYFVNDTIQINLNVNREEGSERTLIFPRGLLYSVIVTRKVAISEWFKGVKIFPIRQLLGAATVVKGVLSGNATDSINITAQYTINEDRYNNGENLTMHLFVMGMIPGDIDGLSDKIPIVDYKKINIDVNYV